MSFGNIVSLRAFEEWIQELLWEKQVPGESNKIQVIRLKAFVCSHDGPFLFQGVCELYDKHPIATVSLKESRVVFIGRHLDQLVLQRSLENCVFNSEPE